MEFIEKTKKRREIKIGDLVCYNGRSICLAICIPKDHIVSGGMRHLEFPYKLVNLNSGAVENAYADLKSLNESEFVRFLAENKDVELHY